jgi:hypothetical protein
MPMNITQFAVVAAVICSSPTPAFTQGTAPATEFLPPAQAIKLIADGQPWTGLAGEGKRMTIVLNKDGTGSMRGPMPMALSVSWRIQGPEVCMDISIAGTKCVRFRQVPSGFEGWSGNAVDMRLSR